MSKSFGKYVTVMFIAVLITVMALTAVGCQNAESDKDPKTETSAAVEREDDKVNYKEKTDIVGAEMNKDGSKEIKGETSSKTAENKEESPSENKENSTEESLAAAEESSVKAENSEQSEESKKTENSEVEESSKKEEAESSHQEACEHNWAAVYKTVYHDAEYDVIHHDAVYETVHHDAEYQTVHHDAVTEQEEYGVVVCSTCGREFATVEENTNHQIETSPDGYLEKYDENGNMYYVPIRDGKESDDWGCNGYYVDTRYRTIVVQEAYDEEVLVKDAWDEQVVVTEAWDEYVLKKDAWTEEVLDHYECSKCGEWK